MKNHYYTTKDVLKKVRITRPTLYKRLREGKIPETVRDRNDFRLFTDEDIRRILAYKNRLKQPKHNNCGKHGKGSRRAS